MLKPAVAIFSIALCVFSAAAIPTTSSLSNVSAAFSAFFDPPELNGPNDQVSAKQGKKTLAPQATYFSQDFSSSSVVTSYVHSTTPTSGQFNAITQLGDDMAISISSGRLQFVKTGSASATYSRTTDFSPTPSTLKYSFTFDLTENVFLATNAATFQVGAGFTAANGAATNATVHSQFGVNFTTTAGQWSLRNLGALANSSNFSGTQTITWYINDSGASINYTAPNGSTESLADDAADVWVGNTRALDEVAATTGTQPLTDIKFWFGGGSPSTIRLDNIVIEDITPVPELADWVNLQWPPSFSGIGGQESETIYGQIFEPGITEPAGQGAGVTAQVGWGPLGSDPQTDPSWTFTAAAFNGDFGNNDEYAGTFTLPNPASTTQYSYTYRYSLDGGMNWTYGDLDGSGTLGGTFNPANVGTMTIDPGPDLTPPDTTITGGPSGTVTDSTATFSFDSSESGSTFECSLDGVAFTACSSGVEYAGLANGNHYFQVRATDGAGNTDGSPDSSTFTVRAGAGAVTFIVDRLDDSASADECIDAITNDCSLRRAIETSADGDTVTFDPGLFSLPEGASLAAAPQTIVLNGSEIQINTDIAINGPGVDQLTIDAGASPHRIFLVNNSTVEITDVSLTGGDSVEGGAISASGALTVRRVWFFGNNAGSGGGGAIKLQSGTHTIEESTFSSNTAVGCAALINFVGSNAVIRNSTLSGNTITSGVGGAICNQAGGILEIANSTLTNNATGGNPGGGVFIDSGSLTIRSSIIAGNTAPGGPDIFFAGGSVTSGGFNLIGDSAGDSTNTGNAIAFQSTDIVDTPPLLGPLQDNGGPTLTHGFSGLSPAIDAGSAFGLTTDQRGLNRTVNYPSVANVDDGTDIGAYELLAPTAAPASLSGRVLTRSGAGIRGAVVTVQGLDGEVRSVTTNTFGHYRIEGLTAGASYVVTVSSRRYAFANGPQLISLDDNISGLDFAATQ